MIIPDEWSAWKDNPTTRAVMALLRQRINERKQAWAVGRYTAQDQFGTAIANACAIGECQAYEAVLDFDAAQVNGELES